MVRGPTDLPNRRDLGGPDFEFVYTPEFTEALVSLIPDGVERRFFVRDGLEYRVNRAIELNLVTGDPELEWNGYLITEAGIASMPECIAWFTIDAPQWTCVFETIERTEGTSEEEDES